MPVLYHSHPPGGSLRQAAWDLSSSVAWRHVNLTGTFDFRATPAPIDLEAQVARYSDPEFWRRSLQEEDGEKPGS